jgi:hypothetical protein
LTFKGARYFLLQIRFLKGGAVYAGMSGPGKLSFPIFCKKNYNLQVALFVPVGVALFIPV